MIILGYSGLDNSMHYVKTRNKDLQKGEEKMIQGLDSAAALMIDGKIIACAEEERFNGEKQSGRFPKNAIDFCLKAAHIAIHDVDIIAHGFDYGSFKDIFLEYNKDLYENVYDPEIQRKLWYEQYGISLTDARFIPVNHHLAHGASAYFPSGFQSALCFVCDGMGENNSSTMYKVENGQFFKLSANSIRNSLGILYGIITSHLGYEFNADEYKVMGLAAYGDPGLYRSFFDKLIHYEKKGKIEIDWEQFGIEPVADPFHRKKLEYLDKNVVPRGDGGNCTEALIRFAASAQEALERCFEHILTYWQESTGIKRICMAGGVLLNCKNNGKLLATKHFDEIYIQPAAGDDGTALGAALYVSHQHGDCINNENVRQIPFYGPSFTEENYAEVIDKYKVQIQYEKFTDFQAVCCDAAYELKRDCVIGWFQGRMEYGPRALGGRSIIANPMSRDIKERLNSIVKFRESYRPFAPAILRDAASTYFDLQASPIFDYMLATCMVKPEYRDMLIGITHVDGSARLQIVDQKNEYFYELLKCVGEAIGCPCIINTSFNVKGQPIIYSPDIAMQTFLRINMNILYLGNFKITKKEGSY